MRHDKLEHPRVPDDLRQLEGTLRQVRFEPRASFGVELEGRVRRGEQPVLGGPRIRVLLLRPLLAALAGLFTLWVLAPEGRITIDLCCYDLDGGGVADDGARIIGERDGRVFRLSLYEDRDGSGSLTSSDIVRYDRKGTPVAEQRAAPGQNTINQCCHDLDGGGPADDGLVVLVTPPDRVHTAAIYQLR